MPTFWPYLHASIFLIKRDAAVSVVFGNDVIAAATLSILKLLIFWNDCIDISYEHFKFHMSLCIIHKVIIMLNSMYFGNDVIVAAILNI